MYDFGSGHGLYANSDNVSRGTQTDNFDANPEFSLKSSYQLLLSERERVAKDIEMMRIETQKLRRELQLIEVQSIERTKEEEVTAKQRVSLFEESVQNKYLQHIQEASRQKDELNNERNQFLLVKIT